MRLMSCGTPLLTAQNISVTRYGAKIICYSGGPQGRLLLGVPQNRLQLGNPTRLRRELGFDERLNAIVLCDSAGRRFLRLTRISDA